MTVCKFLCKFSTCRHNRITGDCTDAEHCPAYRECRACLCEPCEDKKIPCTVAAVTGETEKIDYTGIIPETEGKVK